MTENTITYRGYTRTISEWAALRKINYHTLLARIKAGWSPRDALNPPLRRASGGQRRHGRAGTKEYKAWLAMRRRCRVTTAHNSHRYVVRGIKVCREWV
jgi:hypothetical protein